MSEPLLKLKSSDDKVNRLSLIKARAAARTRRRIIAEIENREIDELERKIARGEADVEEVDAITAKKAKKTAKKAEEE